MSESNSNYHKPVMLKECIEGLDIRPEGVYVDLTFGGGGHSRAILEKLNGGHLYAFDQDQDAKANAEKINNSSFTFIEGNFRYLKRYLKMYGVKAVDGVLGDLGISSHQIDDAKRGFSTRFDAELDMRMDQSATKTARQVVNEYSEEDLHRILGMYGEVRNARTLARAIVAARINAEIRTIEDLKRILNKYVKRGKENRYYAQVFQAIRIEVNEELKALEEVLEQSSELLATEGRLVIMSYHSLEDRLVKNYIMKGKVSGDVEKDFYGNVIKPLEAVTRKPVTASEDELKENNRARSAKLRIAKKL
ncbi:16S rRNA (cytosine(1402)-N(4))-methyltransferase RsmH [Fulvivirga ulvae]|uniref:16S rRNA (cytosine(1402)-N(4))-methyltransferase RsmH n=1 Tax=Fulvivirga ulvae TaxID=2904245 RepID=UPI001F42A3E7|nr:16S rRNA (cytosine(1402)-N(4))-methyltransferase RsmH [Fulvivirga ulvae]UII32664.1 16S rRNA (cytosine(1402)-N(4))-methyltransferase RsmH [Fulvivirga ulvae]